MDESQGGPTLVSTGSRGGWKLPALVVLVLLAGLVAITRLGGSPAPLPAPPSELALAPSQEPTSTSPPTPTPEPTRAQITVNHLPGVMRRSPDGLTYVDGIPTGISGEPVYRVRDALVVPVGRVVLVGGWFVARACGSDGRPQCPAATMSDVRISVTQRGLATYFVALDGQLAGSGAHIVRAMVEADPGCAIRAGSACQPRLRVLQQIWSGAG